jgi:hypothetical protein
MQVGRSRARRGAALLALAGLAFLLPACSSSRGNERSAAVGARYRSLMIVGDSVAVQSSGALVHLAPEGIEVTVDATQGGSAPCDWNHGFVDPDNQESLSFASILSRVKPDAVVFMFTGNPGLSGMSAGCLDAKSDYTLGELLASYEPALTTMANKAVAGGAQVYFEAPPPRNPAVAPGWDPATHSQLGYHGVPEIATLYQDLAAEQPRSWHYDDSAGRAVSSAGLWAFTLPCQPWDTAFCTHGQVEVRIGRKDTIHLDSPGCGAIRFALALEEHILDTTQPDPQVVATATADYGGCQK